MTPPFRNFPFPVRLVLIFVLFFFNISVVSLVALMCLGPLFGVEKPMQVASGVFNSRADVNAFLFIQAVSSIGGFIITPLMFSWLEVGEFKRHLKLNIPVSLKFILLAIASIFVAQGFIEFLVEVNGKIPLPEALNSLKEKQAQMDAVIKALLNFSSPLEFFVVAIVVAVIPAIGEELFFRGLIMGSMLKARIDVITSIVLSGLLFAIVHFEFQNTLAIWALGCFLGYLYYVSGSLWLPIIAHFTNNFLTVLLKYLSNTGFFAKDLTDTPMPIYVTALSILLFAGCIYVFHRWKISPAMEPDEGPSHTEETTA